MVTPPRVSVVIPTHNGGPRLAETLQSVQAQTLADWEVVVADDHSRDNTVAIVGGIAAQDARVRLVHLDAPGGWGPPTRNFGFARTTPRTPFVIFLDHDDLWEPHTLQTLVTVLERQPNASGAHGFHRCINSAGDFVDADGPYRRMALRRGGRLALQDSHQPTTFAVMTAWCCIRTPGLLLLRRNALPPHNPFPLHDGTGLDWDLWIEILRHGDFAFINEPLLRYRIHATNASANRRLYNARIAAIRRRIWEGVGYTDAQRKLVRDGYRAVEAHYFASKLGYAVAEAHAGQGRGAMRQLAYALRHLARYLVGRP